MDEEEVNILAIPEEHSKNSNNEESGHVHIISMDNELFDVNSKFLTSNSKYFKNLLEANPCIKEIKINNINSTNLKRIFRFFRLHQEHPLKLETTLKINNFSELLPKPFLDFLNEYKLVLFELLNISDFLEIDILSELLAVKIASMINGKNLEQIREFFMVSDDFSDEERTKLELEYEWIKYL